MAKKKQVSRGKKSRNDEVISLDGLCLKNEIDFGFSTGVIRSIKPDMTNQVRAMMERSRKQKKEKE